jgi:hypothetical protein
MNTINYKQIFIDILQEKQPLKLQDNDLVSKINNIKSFIDVISINTIIFQKAEHSRNKQQQKLKIYTLEDIQIILNYQKEYNLNDSQTANHFQMSRNTLKKWKDRFKNFEFDN